MKTYAVYSKDGKLESYFIICHNDQGTYQLVSLPWNRIDKRIYQTEQEALEDLRAIVWKSRESIVKESSIHFNKPSHTS